MIREQTENYRLHRAGEREFLTFPAFDAYPELAHLFTTRRGGVSGSCCESWNFGAFSLDREENIRRNYQLLAEVLGIPAERMVRTDQTHTINIRKVTEEDAGKGITAPRDYTDVDGLVTDVRRLAIVTGHADCNAVFFYDPAKKVIGLAHSGWKGTLAGISRAMIEKMTGEYGCAAEDIIAGLGPALCQDCFEVDADVAEAFFAKDPAYEAFSYWRGVKSYIDLKAVIAHDLMDCGVLPEHFNDMTLCTKCNKDDFFSHRGHRGKRGIMAAAMMLK